MSETILPTRSDFQHLFAKTYKLTEDVLKSRARAEQMRDGCEGQVGEEWRRREGLIRQAWTRLLAAQRELDGARSALKASWDKTQPFPNPVTSL